MKRRHRRLIIALACIALAAGAAMLVLKALNDTAMFFYSPSDIAAMPTKPQGRVRVGGMVVEGSVVYRDPKHVAFTLTDFERDLNVSYAGILPDLFREGQGIIAQGQVTDEGFIADSVLAKHDETYMPPEVAKTLKTRQQGAADGGV